MGNTAKKQSKTQQSLTLGVLEVFRILTFWFDMVIFEIQMAWK